MADETEKRGPRDSGFVAGLLAAGEDEDGWKREERGEQTDVGRQQDGGSTRGSRRSAVDVERVWWTARTAGWAGGRRWRGEQAAGSGGKVTF